MEWGTRGRGGDEEGTRRCRKDEKGTRIGGGGGTRKRATRKGRRR